MPTNDVKPKGFLGVKIPSHREGNKSRVFDDEIVFATGLKFSRKGFGCVQAFVSLVFESGCAVVDDVEGIRRCREEFTGPLGERDVLGVRIHGRR